MPRFPTDSDAKKAAEYAMKKICAEGGLDSRGMVCIHREKTCNILHRSQSALKYLAQGKTYGGWVDGKCIAIANAVEIDHLNKVCRKRGLALTLRKSGVEECHIDKSYCNSKVMSFKNNRCHTGLGQKAAEAVFGKTVTRNVLKASEFVNDTLGYAPGSGYAFAARDEAVGRLKKLFSGKKFW